MGLFHFSPEETAQIDRSLAKLLEHCGEAVIFKAKNGALLGNDAFCGILDVSREELIRLTAPMDTVKLLAARLKLSDQNTELLGAAVAALISNADDFTTEIGLSDGRWLRFRGTDLGDGQTAIFIDDITALRSASFAKAVLDDLQAPVYALDDQERVVYSNRSFDRTMAAEAEAVTAAEKLEEWRTSATLFDTDSRDGSYVLKSSRSASEQPALKEKPLRLDTGGSVIAGVITHEADDDLQAQLNAVLSTIDYGVMFMDKDLNIKIINEKCLEYWRADPDQRGKHRTLRDLLEHVRKLGLAGKDLSETEWEAFVAARETAAREGNFIDLEYRIPDGRTLLHSSVAVGEDRMLTYFDVTNYKNQQAELEAALERSHLAYITLNQLNKAVSIKNTRQEYVFVNDAYCKLFQVAREDVIGNHDGKFLEHGGDGNQRENDARVLADGRELDFTEVVAQAGREDIVVQTVKRRIETPSGDHFVVTTRNDITKLKQRERALSEAVSRAELAQEVLERLNTPVIVRDQEHRCTVLNEAYLSFFNLTRDAVIGKRADETLPEELAKEVMRSDGALFAQGGTATEEATYQSADGTTRTTLANKSRVQLSDGNTYIVATIQDITQFRQQQHELEKALRTADLSRNVLDQLGNPVMVKDRNLRYVMANEAFAQLVGKPLDEVIGGTVHDVVDPQLAERLVEINSIVLAEKATQDFDSVITREDGTSVNVLNRHTYLHSQDEDYVISILTDVTRLREQEEDLRDALRVAELSKEILEKIPMPVAAKSADLKYTVVNSAFSRMFGLAPEDMFGRTAAECLPLEAAKVLENMDLEVLETGGIVRREERLHSTDTADGRNYISSKSLVTTDDGDRYIIGVITDVSDMKRRERELMAARRAVEEQNQILQETKSQAEYDSLHDALTGLPNRRFLDQRLCEWRDGTREKELALLQIDLDRFKAINDTLGHAAGDFILKHVASVLKENCDPDDFIARIGGDEFIVLREADVAREELEFLADQVITELNKPVPYEDDLCRFGASIGIDVGIASMGEDLSDQASDPARLMMNADIALYRAKREGRGRFTFFSRELQKEIERSKRISDDILEGLEKGEFFPVYQPQFDGKTLELVGVEALARWNHPLLGVLAPTSFLDAAKEIGAADQIDHAILEAALADLRIWDAEDAPLSRVAVNVSAQRMSNPFLINLLKKLNLPRNKLAFELHESTMLDHTNEELKQQIREIAELGIDIEIDNFGTGQSSFLGMWSASPRRVKIDRELVRPIVASSEHRRLLQAVVDMGRSINLEVVSEGVETIQHVKILREMGVDVLQGYALAKPMSSEELVEFSLVNQRFAIQGRG